MFVGDFYKLHAPFHSPFHHYSPFMSPAIRAVREPLQAHFRVMRELFLPLMGWQQVAPSQMFSGYDLQECKCKMIWSSFLSGCLV